MVVVWVPIAVIDYLVWHYNKKRIASFERRIVRFEAKQAGVILDPEA